MSLSVAVTIGLRSVGVVSMRPDQQEHHRLAMYRRIRLAVPDAEISVVLQLHSYSVETLSDAHGAHLPAATSSAVLNAVDVPSDHRGRR